MSYEQVNYAFLNVIFFQVPKTYKIKVHVEIHGKDGQGNKGSA